MKEQQLGEKVVSAQCRICGRNFTWIRLQERLGQEKQLIHDVCPECSKEKMI